MSSAPQSRPPLDFPDWILLRPQVVAQARLLYEHNVAAANSAAPYKLLKRLVTDPRMEKVWKELFKLTGENGFKKTFVNFPFGFVNGIKEEWSYEDIPSMQEDVAAYMFYNAFGYALSPLVLKGKQERPLDEFNVWEALRHLRNAEVILRNTNFPARLT